MRFAPSPLRNRLQRFSQKRDVTTNTGTRCPFAGWLFSFHRHESKMGSFPRNGFFAPEDNDGPHGFQAELPEHGERRWITRSGSGGSHRSRLSIAGAQAAVRCGPPVKGGKLL